MRLKLITLSGLKADDDVYEVIMPTADGDIAIYPGHEPLVTVAVTGVVRIRRKKTDRDEDRTVFAINGGVVEISPQEVKVLVDEADAAEDIIEEEARAALERARAAKASAKDSVELEKAQQIIDRHAVRLKVAEFKRRRYKG